ncbi:heat shock protein 70, putative [Entamoeba histolytica HM-1:IMSS-B]|nr:heat shock protein 70, putative [Entamoeba histolytica HM-1:IMSS-B]
MTQKEKITYKKKLVRLKKEAERVKVELSDRINNELAKKEVKTTKDIMPEVELELDSLLGKEHSEDNIGTIITRQEFEKECEARGLYERFINKIKQITQKKGYKKGNVQLVLLIGGTSKMPRIREEVSNLFGQVIFSNNNFNPLTAVVKGAAYLAHLKQENAIGHEVVYDIVPIPIGIEVEGGKFEVLVKDGETLPTKGTTRQYCTTRDNQTNADFIIYRGFGKYVSSLGVERVTKLSINGIPSGKRGEQKFEFTIHINKNGMMEISASLIGGNIKEKLSTSLDLSKTSQEIERLIEHFQKFF